MSATADVLFDLSDKRVLVTGASRGIGRAIAEGFLARGARVFAVARSEGALRELRAMAEREGWDCSSRAMDLFGPDAAAEAVSAASAALGGLDVLVNNAGVDVEKSAFQMSLEEFRYVMDFNVLTNFVLMREAARIFVAQRAGKIVNVTSGLSAVGIHDDSAYVASKHGLLGLTRALAIEWGPTNVQVNALAPGWVRTEMTKADVGVQENLAWILDRTPLRRVAEPSEMVGAAVFLASRASDYMTGQTVFVDAGWTAQ